LSPAQSSSQRTVNDIGAARGPSNLRVGEVPRTILAGRSAFSCISTRYRKRHRGMWSITTPAISGSFSSSATNRRFTPSLVRASVPAGLAVDAMPLNPPRCCRPQRAGDIVLRAEVERSSAPNASTRSHLGLSLLSALRSSTSARISTGAKRGKGRDRPIQRRQTERQHYMQSVNQGTAVPCGTLFPSSIF
jgi:hypothetical protein